MSMFKSSVRYAVFCAAFLIIMFFLSEYLGSNPLIDLSQLLFDAIIFGVFIFFAIKDYRTNQGDCILYFWQGMSIGFFIYMTVAIAFSLFLGIYLWLDPGLLAEYKTSAVAFLSEKQEMYEEELGKELYQTQLDGINSVTATDLWVSSGVKKIIAGFFVTPVISIILRRKPK